ncbi:MAG TPA: MFS transporter [Thermoanaerobacterales bacterium]|nr:MFS transporter [Thermoanaerobacterales bacterium]
MKKGLKIQVALLCLVPFIMVLGNSMLIPVLPQIKKAAQINQFQAGLLITAFSLPAGLTIPFAGVLSDQIGRRKVMAPALVLYGLGGIVAGISAMALESAFWGILAGRIIQGIGAGGTYQLAMAIAGDTFQSRERVYALGLLEASNGLGKVASPVLGTAFALVSWFFPFFAYGFLAIPTGLILFLFVKEKVDFKSQVLSDYFTAVRHIFRQKASGLLSSFFAGMAALFSLFGILSLYSDILEERFAIFGLKKGLIMAGPVFIMATLSFLLGIILPKRKNKGLKAFISGGLAIIAAAQVLFIFARSLWATILALCLLGAGVGLVMTPVNTLVTGSCSTKRRGIVTCLYGSLRFFGVAVGPPLYGLSEGFGTIPVVLLAGSASALALILSLALIDQNKILAPDYNQKASVASGADALFKSESGLKAPSRRPLIFRKKLR